MSLALDCTQAFKRIGDGGGERENESEGPQQTGDLNFNGGESTPDLSWARLRPDEPHVGKRFRSPSSALSQGSSVHREQIDPGHDGAVSRQVWRWLCTVRYRAHGVPAVGIHLSEILSIAV